MNTTETNKFNFRIATWASLILMLVIMLVVSKDFGISGDEITQNTYGLKVFDYYASFGKDKACLEYKNVYYYGGFYDLLCVTVNKIVSFDPFDTRHFINAIFGWMAIMVSALLARRYKGWGAALLTAWFLFLSPRFFGESMNNPKDIPFALGMVWGVFCIDRFIKAFPKPSLKTSIWLAVAIGYTIGIRVGGLLLIPFFVVAVGLEYVFNWQKSYKLGSKEIRSYLVRCVIVCIAGYAVGMIFWPYALQDPLSNPFKALGEMSQFSTSIRMLFDDQSFMSSTVPWYYIPKWIGISCPVIILLGIIISPFLLFTKKFKIQTLLFLFFIAIFPWVYIVYKKSSLYDGWRHMLFIYPYLVILAALAFTTIIDMVKKAGKYVVVGIIVIGLLLPAKWSIANHPHEIVYFNELEGGIDGAFGYYETDYYMNGMKKATYKLANIAHLRDTKDSIIIATNCIEPMDKYVARINPRIKTVYVRYYQRYDSNWDYAIFYSRFIDKDLLQNGYFPPSHTIATIKADNTPLYAILKNDTARDAYKAHQYMQAKDFANGAKYYQKALASDPKNETAYANYAICLASIGQIQPAIDVLNESLKMMPNSAENYQILAQLYQAKGDMQQAQQANNMAQSIMMKEQGEE